MVFIDGGYLRSSVNHVLGDSKADKRISYRGLKDFIVSQVAMEGIRPELIRAYYYDAIADPEKYPEECKKQKEYFAKVQKRKSYELRLGRWVKTEDGHRQKGVDILLTLDMLSKGFLGHYDVAAFVGGDDDFRDLIYAVKNLAGRRVFGFYFSHNTTEEMRDSFDVEIVLSKAKVENIMLKKTDSPTSITKQKRT
jgi:uncharacterized LabA/DUF88 family protein